ncbi:asparagine synthetase B [Psychromarinibacter sp. C21-152]|uniref:asparagine synthase (glutamine-hydrolyzing) n=1 Tax=Psychromarinibacter sediminicola TaxID=3033385 RepID=A0AAE3NXQ0_9RHOB|nr:asparagine synthetase B [Psychromarinibacter sediminicola]MDF0602567.1 asparagine synthetase B [Psychromarinibacter sediminicola]
MCGIVGVFGTSPDRAKALAARVLGDLSSRGPDAVTLAATTTGAIGAARLRISDPAAPDQPMTTPDGAFRLALNGEIWNDRDLRRRLQAGGARFATACDTETVLHAVAAAGPDAPQMLDGQFAYIAQDMRTGQVHAARDPFGICPLWRAHLPDGGLILASSIAPILDAGAHPGTLRALPQGHSLSFHPASGKVTLRRYSDSGLAEPHGRPDPADPQALLAHLATTIRRRIPAEVPYATITGGIDSSLVTAICQTAHRPPTCTITVAACAADTPDIDNARQLQAAYGTRALVGRVDADFIRDALPLVIERLASAQYLVVLSSLVALKAARMAREAGAKVILTGGGADELFGGYTYLWTLFDRAQLAANLSHILRQTGAHECHREDAIIAATGIEPRPAYFDLPLARAVAATPPEARIRGLGSARVTEKALLKAAARRLPGFPPEIVARRKAPFYRSTAIAELFETVAAEMLPPAERDAWIARHIRGTAWESMMFGGRTGPVLVHKLFCERFPGLAAAPLRLRPPDYGDPDDYGRYAPNLGAPALDGFSPVAAARQAEAQGNAPSPAVTLHGGF